ncbi:MAG TPA: 6-hydroxymethylpterin diphosphokinase MptE-like protein [Nitrosopumilaceae archaeon]|nr:6-hydroxymethylpterin diphosphokinase MptE-like protein [Nitrosopumilaceae archaeon]
MKLKGWGKKYTEILREFQYSRRKDAQSARVLNSILRTKFPLKKLEKVVKNQTIFVIGAGSSLNQSIPFLKKYKKITKIVADGASKALIENKIKCDIVVTDLDGDQKFLKKAGKENAIMIVHAHGDNIDKLHLASDFKYCIGTTEGKPFGNVRNFGGFTDGDRCVFLAKHFCAKKIILFGMDFGTKIGRYSKNKVINRATKIRKLRRGKKLLEWLALQDNSDLYTTSRQIKGFNKIRYADLGKMLKI